MVVHELFVILFVKLPEQAPFIAVEGNDKLQYNVVGRAASRTMVSYVQALDSEPAMFPVVIERERLRIDPEPARHPIEESDCHCVLSTCDRPR